MVSIQIVEASLPKKRKSAKKTWEKLGVSQSFYLSELTFIRFVWLLKQLFGHNNMLISNLFILFIDC